jgi:hypothetical protein
MAGRRDAFGEQTSPRESRLWRLALTGFLRGAPMSVMRQVRRRVPDAPIEEVIIVGRRSGKERRLLLSVYDVDGRWYIGHPNGTAQWVRNLESAGECIVIRRDGIARRMSALELERGPERDGVLSASTRQPAPAGFVYKRARRHVDAAGRYFRLTPVVAAEGSGTEAKR